MNETRRLFHTRPMAGAALGAVLAAILGSLAPDWVLLAVCALLVPVSAFLFHRRSAFFLLPLFAFLVLVRIVLLPTAMPSGPVAAFLGNLRGNLCENADVLFRDESAAAKGMLLGDPTAMTSLERSQYAKSGLIHLFAVSGLHVTLLAGMLGNLVRTDRKWLSVSLLVAFLLFFCAVTGFSASVLRAAFALIALRLCSVRERKADMPTIFCFAMAMTLLCSPFDLFRTGFGLSFSAMGGMVLFAKTFRRPLPYAIRNTRIAIALSGAAAATVGMIPLMAYHFGYLAWISIPLSILLIPAMPVILLFGFLSVLLYGLTPAVAAVLSYPAYGAIRLVSLTAKALDVPALRLPSPHPAAIVLFYLALLLCSRLFLPNRNRPPWIGLGLLAVSILLWFMIP
jgi:competence protein ComEC